MSISHQWMPGEIRVSKWCGLAITASDCNTRPHHQNRTAPKARPRETIWLHWLMKQMFYLRATTTMYFKDQKVSTHVWKKKKEKKPYKFTHHLLIRFSYLKEHIFGQGWRRDRKELLVMLWEAEQWLPLKYPPSNPSNLWMSCLMWQKGLCGCDSATDHEMGRWAWVTWRGPRQSQGSSK